MTEFTGSVNLRTEHRRRKAKNGQKSCIQLYQDFFASICIKRPKYPDACGNCEWNRLDRTFRKPVSMVNTWSTLDQPVISP
jgi:hypothetical protein